MKPAEQNRVSVRLKPNDFTVYRDLALSDRRKISDVIRNLLEDIVNGKVVLEDLDPKPKEKFHLTSVRVGKDLFHQIEGFKEKTNLSLEKILHLAAEQLSRQSPPH